jgi:hypothetical protein
MRLGQVILAGYGLAMLGVLASAIPGAVRGGPEHMARRPHHSRQFFVAAVTMIL